MLSDHSITAKTGLCAVIGNPIGHSLSPALHNAAFNFLGLDFVYVAFKVEDLKSAINGMRALQNFRGMSVTIPHKIEIIDYLDEVDEVDRFIGSVNTVISEGGKLRGFGTDGPGALKAITDSGFVLDGARVVMLGAGGAARAIAFTLARSAKLGGITLLDINEGMLVALAADLRDGTDAEISCNQLDADSITGYVSTADLVINCTPVGMYPKVDTTVVPREAFRPGQTVFDVVYTPLETRLLREAAEAGCRVISGVDMFINQAALQFRAFTGQEPPLEVMRTVVLEHLSK